MYSFLGVLCFFMIFGFGLERGTPGVPLFSLVKENHTFVKITPKHCIYLKHLLYISVTIIKTKIMKPEFKIYKSGVTEGGKVTIMSKNGEPFDREAKIRKFIALGYFVFDLNDKLITL